MGRSTYRFNNQILHLSNETEANIEIGARYTYKTIEYFF